MDNKDKLKFLNNAIQDMLKQQELVKARQGSTTELELELESLYHQRATVNKALANMEE
jgi:hypothetical protein